MPKPKKSTANNRELILHQENLIGEAISANATHSDSEISLPESPEKAVQPANLHTILQELRDSRRENENNFRELKENINARLDETERRVAEVDDRTQRVEEATLMLIKAQEELQAKVSDLEGRWRRENVRLHGVTEGAEDGAQSVSDFVTNLLKEKLNIPLSLDLTIERAHRSLGPKPPPEAAPRSIVVKFTSYRTKEEVLKRAWQQKGFMLNEKKVFVDHDYAPDVLKKRREYTEAKKVLRERKIKFQTPYPAKLRVFYEGETRLYTTAAEATKDMAGRGFGVTVIKPPVTWADKIKSTMWRSVGQTQTGGPLTEDSPTEGYKKKLEAFRRE
ncbi:hypothetical protein WMY93_032281 [Mugilogobius chulae]|uniref:L1 transposable element RRM domain-containing protein n=1 Tax=Mugilogobius chulae TaxID=88201 RepID=A0AAW0MK49_9GOBI